MSVSYKRLRQIIQEEVLREQMRLTNPGLVFTRSGLEVSGSVLYDINELREMKWNDLVGLKLTYPIHVSVELQDRLYLPENIKSLDELTEVVEYYTAQMLSEGMLQNLLEDASDDLISRITEFVKARADADGTDLDTLPKADLAQLITDAAMDEDVPDQDLSDLQDEVIEALVSQGEIPASYLQ